MVAALWLAGSRAQEAMNHDEIQKCIGSWLISMSGFWSLCWQLTRWSGYSVPSNICWTRGYPFDLSYKCCLPHVKASSSFSVYMANISSWCNIVFMYCWIQLPRILLRIFVSIFMSDILICSSFLSCFWSHRMLIS